MCLDKAFVDESIDASPRTGLQEGIGRTNGVCDSGIESRGRSAGPAAKDRLRPRAPAIFVRAATLRLEVTEDAAHAMLVFEAAIDVQLDQEDALRMRAYVYARLSVETERESRLHDRTGCSRMIGVWLRQLLPERAFCGGRLWGSGETLMVFSARY